jgi:hypothetical protein
LGGGVVTAARTLREPEVRSVRGQAVDLAELIRAHPTDQPDRYTIDVPDGVQQGRGAWGGVATGAMTSAALQAAASPNQELRTMSAQLVAPLLTGRSFVRTDILRAGSATTTVAARVESAAGEVVAHGVVVLGAARQGDGMPDGPSWAAVTPPDELAAGPEAAVAIPAAPPAPDFLTQIQLRPTVGLPFSGAGPEARGWLQPFAAVSRVDATLLVALADTWWVAVMAGLARPRPVATVGFACELTGAPELVQIGADGRMEPLFHRGRVVSAREGFTVETRELWTASGHLLTWNTQTVAVIK